MHQNTDIPGGYKKGNNMKIIDIHQHYAIPEYFQYLEKNHAMFEDSILLPKKKTTEMIDLMNRAGTDLAVVELSSPHPFYILHAQEGIDLCRKLNEEGAWLRKSYPNRFRFCAVVPLPDVNAAIHEACYALDELGASGIKLATNSRGQYLGDPSLDPLFEELNRRKAVITIHPHKPSLLDENLFSARTIPVFEFFADTTRAVMNMMGNHVLERYPDLKIVVPHCGAFLPNIADRGQEFMPLLRQLGVLEKVVYIKEHLPNFYYDIAGNPVPDLLPFLLNFVSPDHVMYGSDYPFTPDDRCVERVREIEDFFDHSEKWGAYKEDIFYKNAMRVFGIDEL